MPLLFDQKSKDVLFLNRLAENVCTRWNENSGPEEFGIRLFYSTDAIEKIVEEGENLLTSLQHTMPGPFKRLAALLVLARLNHLFTLATSESVANNVRSVAADKESLWVSRPIYFLIGETMSVLQINGKKAKIHLGEWKGFPSYHSRAEFLQLLAWFCDMPMDSWHGEKRYNLDEIIEKGGECDDFKRVDANFERRQRMILAVSLILEAVHYQGTKLDYTVVGCCDNELLKLDEEPRKLVFFDQYLVK
jgi:hypothetical protein